MPASTLVYAVTGAPFTADSARAEAYKQSNGARGVTLPTDLKVSALPTPGPFVRVQPGGATMPAGYPQAPGQSYSTYEQAAVDVPVPATGSGGAVTRILIQRITDPQFEGQAPANPLTHEYATYEWVSSLNGLNFPYVDLVTLVQPASTSTITSAMLTDRRKLTRPRSSREQFMAPGWGTTVGNQLRAVHPAWQNWPVQLIPSFEVPAWATHVRASMNVFGPAQIGGYTAGKWELVIGWAPGPVIKSALSSYDFNTSTTVQNVARVPAMGLVLYDVIPPAMRGTVQTIRGNGNKNVAFAQEPGFLQADSLSQIEFDINFSEKIL